MSTVPEASAKRELDASHVADLKLAASKMLGEKRRAFQAEMTLKYWVVF